MRCCRFIVAMAVTPSLEFRQAAAEMASEQERDPAGRSWSTHRRSRGRRLGAGASRDLKLCLRLPDSLLLLLLERRHDVDATRRPSGSAMIW